MNPQQTPPLPPTPPTPSDPVASTPQPVAYDSEGRPLYAAPPQQGDAAMSDQMSPPPQYVHMARATEPAKQEVSPELKIKHDESVKAFPSLNLSDSEYILSTIRRHPIGLFLPVGITIFLVAVVLSSLINYPLIVESAGLVNAPDAAIVWVLGLLLTALFLIGGYIAVWVYVNNKFFLTNESVIQEIQVSIFSKHEQTVSLSNIEDASFQQHGILQTLLNYGSIRLSTEGDETTYRFQYVANPKEQIALLNNAVEAFKNGRPID